MLYEIKNRSGVVIGVHDCSPKDVQRYLDSLPQQQAPYRAYLHSSMSASRVKRAFHAQGLYRFYTGFLAGFSVAALLHVLMGIIAHAFG